MKKNGIILIGFVGTILVFAVLFRGTFGSLRGGVSPSTLLNNDEIALKLKRMADINADGILSTKEIRRSLTRIIRGVILGEMINDINGDSLVNRADIIDTIREFRRLLLITCGNGDPSMGGADTELGEECDDGNLVSGDGCSGPDAPNGACYLEYCGDGYLDTDGIPDGQGGFLWAEQCDDGGLCEGGSNNGQPCTSLGGDLADIQCPNGTCVPQRNDGCQTNCYLEICGNASIENDGLDGKPGVRGVDDDGDSVVDNVSERWTVASDDEECDPGGSCSLAGHDCLTPGNADTCRRDGGTCSPQTRNGCFDTCKRDIQNFLTIANGSPDVDYTSIPTGTNRTVGVFGIAAEAPPPNYLSYQIDLGDFLFTVHADNVSLSSANISAALASGPQVACVPQDENGAALTATSITDTFYVLCRYDTASHQAVMTLDSNTNISLKMTVLNAKMNNALPSTLQVLLENVATSANNVSFAGSHISWAATNGPLQWMQYRLKDATNSIASTLYGDSPQVCGNGAIDPGETCDDNDTDPGDGCSNACAIEAEFRCTGSPSVCQSYLDFVKALADINSNGTVTDNEALILTLDVAGAPDQPYATVSRFDIDNDGDVDNVDVALILTQLDILAP